MFRLRGALPALLGFASSVLSAQTPVGGHRLGRIDFPTSAGPVAQARFVEGVLYLHSFEYAAAARAFQAAQKAEPGFALAYWGEAMTYNHPVWNERDRDAAMAAQTRLGPTPAARRARAPTPREQAYMDAAEALWAEGPKAARDSAYFRVMERLSAEYPDDLEAKAFLALAWLGLNQGVREPVAYMKAGALALEVFHRNPEHPGGAHYAIHAFDDPVHAPLGLPAARRYIGIAPDAGHAQHMTTHIFIALGMWDDVVSQNQVAAGLTGWGPGHYTIWLGYGLHQQGRFDDARKHLERARAAMPVSPSPRQRAGLAMMQAYYVVDAEQWSGEPPGGAVDLTETLPIMRVIDQFRRGFAAARRGDLMMADSALGAIQRLHTGHPEPVPGEDADHVLPAILELSLRGAIHAARKEGDQAVAALRKATALEDAMPFEFGPPTTIKPTHELLGEILLELGQRQEAAMEFERALALAPGRALSARGLERARGKQS